MPDLVKVVLHISRRGGLSGFARRATAATTVLLRFAIVGAACYVLIERPEISTEAAAALAVGLLWSVVATLLSKPQPPHALVLLTDESLVYAEGATCLDWTDVKSHVVVGNHLIFEPTDAARREDPVVRRRYSIPLGELSRSAVIEAFATRPRR
jgi:hypothetical protein